KGTGGWEAGQGSELASGPTGRAGGRGHAGPVHAGCTVLARALGDYLPGFTAPARRADRGTWHGGGPGDRRPGPGPVAPSDGAVDRDQRQSFRAAGGAIG